MALALIGRSRSCHCLTTFNRFSRRNWSQSAPCICCRRRRESSRPQRKADTLTLAIRCGDGCGRPVRALVTKEFTPTESRSRPRLFPWFWTCGRNGLRSQTAGLSIMSLRRDALPRVQFHADWAPGFRERTALPIRTMTPTPCFTKSATNRSSLPSTAADSSALAEVSGPVRPGRALAS